MMTWVALPTRQPGEVLSKLDYRVEQSPAGQRHVTTFRHRDNRIWQAKIVNEPQTVDSRTYPYMAEVSCAGCRSWVFLSMSLDQSKRTISRFANLAIAMYQRLVADASGTTDFPIPGVVGVFRMRLPQSRSGRDTTPEQEPTEITGVARYDGGQIVVFPVVREFTDILSSVCASDTVALVPQGINEIPAEHNRSGFLLGKRNPLAGMATPQLNEEELHEALGRLRDETVDRVMSGLHTGAYTTTRHREEREIDFGDEESAS